jgi:hypothetical protein
VHPRTNTLSRTARLSPWAFIPWAPQHVRVLRAQIRFRVMRAIPWALIPWAPQHVRVLPRTNTPSRTARLSPWAFTRWAPQHVSVLSRTNTLSRTALFRPGLSSLGRHSTSACFRAQIRFRVLRAITLGSWAPQHVRVLPRTNTLSRTARLSPWAFIPWAPQHVRVLSRTNTLSRIARNRLGL